MDKDLVVKCGLSYSHEHIGLTLYQSAALLGMRAIWMKWVVVATSVNGRGSLGYINKSAAQAADADPSPCNYTNGQNPPIQKNHQNF